MRVPTLGTLNMEAHARLNSPDGTNRGDRPVIRRHSTCMLSMLLLAATAGLTWINQDAYAQRRTRSAKAAQSTGSNAKEGKIIAVLGSSVARGWVTSYEARHDLLNGWAFHLERLLKPRGWSVVNISNPGDDTKDVLARIERDLLPTGAKIVIIGLSMSNEGLETVKNSETVFKSYTGGLQKIIALCRKNGIAPVIGLCHPNDNFDARHYSYIKRMNLLINTWDVPSINFLGPVDNGSGGWIDGYTFDLDHPDDVGHQEMFHAIVPSLFDSILADKPAPAIAESSGHISVNEQRSGAPISFIPEDVIHSFAVAFKVRTSSEGCIAAVKCGKSRPHIEIDRDGRLRYVSATGDAITSKTAVTDGKWHDVVLSHRHLMGETELFVDGNSLGKTPERLAPRQFVMGGCDGGAGRPKVAPAEYRELLVYRSALNGDEVEALHAGKLVQAGLEIYAPLNEEQLDENTPLANLAQSLSKVIALPMKVDKQIAQLEERIEQAGKAKRFIDPNEKTAIKVDPVIFDAYVGKYRVDPGLTLIITKEKGRLLLSPNDTGKTQLHPESETKFFARIMGPEIGVTFVKGPDGKVGELTFHQDRMNIPAKRIR